MYFTHRVLCKYSGPVHRKPLEEELKHRSQDPIPRVSNSVSLGWGSRSYNSNRFTAAPDAAGLRTTGLELKYSLHERQEKGGGDGNKNICRAPMIAMVRFLKLSRLTVIATLRRNYSHLTQSSLVTYPKFP